jgi:N-acetylmuramic acid 6-phosphate etherase
MYGDLPTERIAAAGPPLDLLAPAEVARLLVEEEERAVAAVRRALPEVARACALAAESLRAGGRILYAGAGTSGRLGALDAAEMGPTFGAEPGVVVALVAGGPRALAEAVEGAEDDAPAGRAAVAACAPRAVDLVVGITMSGAAAWVEGALQAARDASARTTLLTANGACPFSADVRVVLELGPELIAGSTRLKGGSATKAVLNAISTAAMAAAGAVYGNLMVRVRPLNRKLRDRAERIVALLAGVSPARAAELLRAGGDDVRVAVLMARLGLPADAARARLQACGGRLREALS